MIQVVNRAFDILEYIARDKNKIFSLSEIADTLKLNHATCANIIKTMVQRNYLEQMGHKKGYRLGFMTFQITGSDTYDQELLKAAKPAMESLTKKINETCLLGILKRDVRFALHQVSGNHDLIVKSSTEKAACNSASGRLLVAMQSKEKLQEFVERYGLPSAEFWKEASTTRGFNTEILKIQRDGYTVQTTKTHISGIAVPVYKAKEVVASLSVYLPESRFNEKIKKDILDQLNKTSEIISRKLSKP
ncbi:MAG TPA: IclR family transcriptional regulator C-terminal domain-containing protein [Cyclobacteriaceae bacterium]|nr:IclR family transcriptional regulator C-terminal domain-containing protein [Cyclobacteriaceae bacterium]